jgi:hypothetical protein
MKKYLSCFAIIIAAFILSCNQSTEKSTESTELTTVVDSSSMECYKAIDGVDTGYLKILTDDKGKVSGPLVINYLDKGDSKGEVVGKYQGDTLFVHYTFKIGSNKTTYKNPLAFLKKDGKLILGVGQIETFLGVSRFVKGKPISFERGRFTFAPVNCD